jgi:hypothetical protein
MLFNTVLRFLSVEPPFLPPDEEVTIGAYDKFSMVSSIKGISRCPPDAAGCGSAEAATDSIRPQFHARWLD